MNLPVEILSLIFEFISDQQSLVLLLRTSRLFKTLAEPLLYRNILFWAHSSRKLPSRILKFKQRIDEEPRLAKYVASYTTLVADEVSAIVPKLINICRLKLGFDTYKVDFNTLHQSFSRLTHLICNAGIDNTPPFARFLESQSSLELLDLSHDLHMFTLSTDALPRLHTLRAGIWNARSILPGRNVRHLRIIGNSGLHGLIHLLPGPTFPSVHSLLGEAVAEEIEVMQAIASLFPNLKYLGFAPYYFSHVEKFPQDHIINSLRQLAAVQIEYFSFTISDTCFFQCRDEVECVHHLNSHLNEFPSLRALYVEYGSKSYSQKYPKFPVLRYHSGNLSPVEMSLPPIEYVDWESWWEIRDLERNPDQVRTGVAVQEPSVTSRS